MIVPSPDQYNIYIIQLPFNPVFYYFLSYSPDTPDTPDIKPPLNPLFFLFHLYPLNVYLGSH